MPPTMPKSLVEDQRTVGINRSLPRFQYDAGNTAEGFGALKNTADRMSRVLFEEAKKDAAASGQADARAAELIKDEDGSLRPITVPEGGGEYYNESFKDVADRRYVRLFGSDFENKARELALNEEFANDPVAYNEALTKAGRLALEAAPEDMRGMLADGVTTVVGKYTTDQQVKAYNLAYGEGKAAVIKDQETYARSIFDAAVAGRPITEEERQAGNDLREEGHTFGITGFDPSRILDVAETVIRPIYAAAGNMTPSQIKAMAAAAHGGDVSNLPVDAGAYASVPKAQRIQIATNLRMMATDKQSGLDGAFSIAQGTPAQRATSSAWSKYVNKVGDANGPQAAIAVAASGGALLKGQVDTLFTLLKSDDDDAPALLEMVMQKYRKDRKSADALMTNLSEGERTLLRTASDLGSGGVETLKRSGLAVTANSELEYQNWIDTHGTALDKAIEGHNAWWLWFGKSVAPIVPRAVDRFKRVAWRLHTGGPGDGTNSLDDAIEAARLATEKRWGVSEDNRLSQAAVKTFNALGGADKVRDFLMNEVGEFDGKSVADMESAGRFVVRVEDQNNATEATFSLYYKPEQGDGVGAWVAVGRSYTLDELGRDLLPVQKPPEQDIKDQETAARASLGIKNAITAGLADNKLGVLIGNKFSLEEGVNHAELGASAKKFFAMEQSQLHAATRNKKALSVSDQAGLNAAIIARNYPGFFDESGDVRDYEPPKVPGLSRITRGDNGSYAGFNNQTNLYMMKGPIGEEQSYIHMTGEQAREAASGAVAMAQSEDFVEAAEGERQLRQIEDILFHYERGGDLIDRDSVLRGYVGHTLYRGLLGSAETAAMKELVYVSQMREERTYKQYRSTDTRDYILKELGKPTIALDYQQKWQEKHGKGDEVGSVSQDTIDFVKRIKAFTVVVPVGPLDKSDMIEPDKDAPSPLSESGLTIERIAIASEAARLGLATDEEKELLAKVRAGER